MTHDFANHAALLHSYLPAGIVLLAPDARILEANDHAVRWLGLAPQQLTSGVLSLADLALLRPDGELLQPAEHPVERARALRQPVRGCVVGRRRPGGELVWARMDVHPECAAGDLHRIVLILIDVTAERVAEQRWQESERRFTEAQQVARMGSFEWDPGTDLLWCSQGMLELHAFAVSGPLVPFARLLEAAAPGARAAMLARREELRAGKDHFEVDLQCVRPDGTMHWIHRRVRAVRAPDGWLLRIDGTDIDITGRKRAEAELAASQSKLVAAMDSMTDAVFISDAAGKLLDFNEAFATFHRFADKAVCARTLAGYPLFLDVYLPDGTLAPVGQWPVPRALAGESVTNAEYGLRRKDTGESWIGSFSFAPIRDSDGAIVGSVVVGRDITEQKRAAEGSRQLREQLLQAQKMESVGRLAGGVAHDFNNLLTVQQGYCELMRQRLRPDDPLAGCLREIEAVVERAAGLTRQLLAFSRKQTLQPKVLDLNLLVSDLGSMLLRLLGEDVELAITMAAVPARVRADPGQLEQVLVNLAVNGRDAMPDGGRLWIEVSSLEVDAHCAEVQFGVAPGSYAMLAVRDTGHGMDEEIQRHIFEPFFTTKGVGKGTGLGLSTVHGIVLQSGGNVWVYSAPGKGTTVKVVLPRVEESGTPTPAQESAMPRGAGELVLLVEDEVALRRLGQQLVESLGYRVQVAENGSEALLLLEQHRLVPDLLITDVVMPGMNGRLLAERARQLLPGLRVLFMSGYTDDATLQHGIETHGLNFMEKPFTLAGLAQKIHAVLAEKA